MELTKDIHVQNQNWYPAPATTTEQIDLFRQKLDELGISFNFHVSKHTRQFGNWMEAEVNKIRGRDTELPIIEPRGHYH